MTCKEFVDSLTEYTDNALTRRKRAEFEDHRIGCGNCRLYFEQMQMLIHAAPALRYTPGEIEVPQKLYELLANKTRRASAAGRQNKLSYKPILAAVAVAVVLAGLWLYQSRYAIRSTPEPRTINLTEWSRVRGLEQPPPPPVELPRAKVILTVELPVGAEPGEYQVGIASRIGEPFLVATGTAKLNDHIATLHANLDLTRIPQGHYRLALRPKSWDWAYLPLRIK